MTSLDFLVEKQQLECRQLTWQSNIMVARPISRSFDVGNSI